MSFAHAFKWSYLAELSASISQPVVFIILAGLLTPGDFGVMAAAMMVIAFSQIFWDAGMGKALIQRQTDIDDAANIAFWVNFCLGVIVAAVLFAAAAPIAQHIFHDNRVMAVLRVMTLQIFLGALASVHIALLQREMGFKKLFWVRLITVGLPGLASIPLAWYGAGYWALVAGALIGQGAQVFMLWHMSKWRPRRVFDFKLAREMGRFGAWVGASGLLGWFYLWADSLIVGMYLGSHELGLYQAGNQFTLLSFAILFGPIAPVLYSHLSRVHQDQERMRKVVSTVIKAVTLVAVPMAILIFSLASPLSGVLFGPKWQGVEWVIGAMALMHGFSWVVGMNGEVYRAMGKPSAETIVTAATLMVYLAIYLFSIRYGLLIFVWARFGLALGALLLHLLVLRAILSMPILPILRYLSLMILIGGIPTAAVHYLLIERLSDQWVQLVAGGVINFVVVAGLLFMLERNGMLMKLRTMLLDGKA